MAKRIRLTEEEESARTDFLRHCAETGVNPSGYPKHTEIESRAKYEECLRARNPFKDQRRGGDWFLHNYLDDGNDLQQFLQGHLGEFGKGESV